MKDKFLFIHALFVGGIIFLLVGVKCTPQWLELQVFSRSSYLFIAFSFMIMGILMLVYPIIRSVNALSKQEDLKWNINLWIK